MYGYMVTQLQESKHLDITHISGTSISSFSEHDILTLNDLLLTKGLHTIDVQNLLVGRNIMSMFLTLLNHYQEVYWLSCNGSIVGFRNVYTMLKEYGCLNQNSSALYEAYLYEAFYADCLIIEYTTKLAQQQWYTYFEAGLCKARIFEQMPVIYINCDEVTS